MSIQVCLTKVKKYVKEAGLSENVTNARIEYFAKRLDAISAESLTPAQFNEKVQSLMEEDLAREAAQRKAALAQTIYRREMNLKDLRDNTEDWSQNSKFGKSKDMAYEAFRVLQQGGSIRPGQGTNMSTPIMANNIKGELLNTFNLELSKTPGLREVFSDPTVSKNALIELASIDNGTEGMTTKDPMAREAAKVMKIFRDRIFQMKQAINPYMESAQDYLWKQFHDRERITAMGKDAWTQLIMTHAGEKSFPELSLKDKVSKFHDMYDKIESGTWGSAAYEGEQGKGANLAKRQAVSRQIQFDSPESFAEYNSQAGPKTLFDGIMRIAGGASRDIALMEKWGPNPEAARNETLKKFKQGLDGEQLAQFERKERELGKQWDVVKGIPNSPAYGTAAKALQGAMSWQYVLHGGFSSFRSPQDLAMGASLLHSLDQSSVFGRGAELAGNFAKALTDSKFRNKQLENYGLFVRSMQESLVSDLGAPENAPGTLSKMARSMGVLNMHTRIVESISASVGHVLTKMMGDVSGTKWASLPESWQQGLTRYGFDENKWDIARLGTEDINGNKHMTPEAIRNIDDVAIENYLRKSGQFKGDTPSAQLLDRGREQLARSVGTMINEHAAMASARTDVRQRDFMWGDTTINDGMGMLRRALWEFKSASLVQTDVARRAYLSGTGPKGDWQAVAKLIAFNALLFGMGDAAKQLAQGKTPEDPRSLNYIGKATLGSGIGGIYLDAMVNAMNENSIKDKGYEMMKSTAGPIGSSIVEGLSTALQAASGKKGAGKGALQWGLGNAVPYQNLPYTKAVFDYYIANSLKEMVAPGHNRSVVKRAQQQGQSYLFGKPTSANFVEGQ